MVASLNYKTSREKRANEAPRSAPPITSVAQCSPRLTLEINIRNIYISTITIKMYLKYAGNFFVLYNKEMIIMLKKITLKECPEG